MGPSREQIQKVMCWQQSREAQVYAEFPGRLVQNKHRYGCYPYRLVPGGRTNRVRVSEELKPRLQILAELL
jgi:hypothetical protein